MKKVSALVLASIILLLCACGAQNEPETSENIKANIIDQQTYDLAYKAITTVDSYNNDELTRAEAEEQLNGLSEDLNLLTDQLDNEYKRSNNMIAQTTVESIWFAFSVLGTNESREYLNMDESETMSNEQCFEEIDKNTQSLVDFLNDNDIE